MTPKQMYATGIDTLAPSQRAALDEWLNAYSMTRAIAALNHPNICQIYGVGPNHEVTELIDDQPLKGPVPLDQALRYAARANWTLRIDHSTTIRIPLPCAIQSLDTSCP